MNTTSKISMELTQNCGSPIIYAVQDDKYSRKLELSLLENDDPWIIPEDASVVIRYSKADGKGGEYDTLPDESRAWSAEENTLTVTLAPQVLTTPGAVNLSVILIRDQVQISTFSVVLYVEAAVHAMQGESEEYIHVPGFLPAPGSAQVGQYLQIASVDASGHVTGTKAVTPANRKTEPEDEDIPKVFFGAALPQTKDDTIMSFRYISKTEDISGWCKTKAQGNSSMAYPKKNQTVKLYADEACTEKLKVNFKGWGEQSKFCFKANWIDLTHARNVVSARLWGDVVKSRSNYETIPELLRTSPNQGAVDGFPVKVYANGIYQGRYTLNIPKDAWMANMDDDLNSHCILCGEGYVSGCFREESVNQWTDEVHDTMPAAIQTRWLEVINFVMNSTDEEFAANIDSYIDLESIIDYYIFGLVTCGLDAFGKNQIYMTYDGQKWYASMYDMDSTWGLYFDGSYFVSDSYSRESYQDFADGEGNLLYIRAESLLADRIRARWDSLKNGVLSVSSIINRFERFTDIASIDLVQEDYAATTGSGAFTAIPSQNTSNIQQIREYAVKRWKYTDGRIAILGNEYLYRLMEPMTFDGTNYLNTYIKPFAEPKDFSVMIAFDSTNEQNYENDNQPALLTLDGYDQIRIGHGGEGFWNMLASGQKQVLETDADGTWGHSWERTKVIVAVFREGVFSYGKYYLNHTQQVYSIPATEGSTYTQLATTNLLVGVRDPWSSTPGYWKGTMNDLRIFNYALSEDETADLIEEAINGGSDPSEPSGDPLYPFINGSYTYSSSGATITTTNGNHVKATKTNTNWNVNYNINIHDVGASVSNFDGINNFVHDTIFSLKAGDKVLTRKVNTVIETDSENFPTRTSSLFLRVGDESTTSIRLLGDSPIQSDGENEITISADTDVGCIGFYLHVGDGVDCNYTLDFDVEIYVNDVRYV